MKFNIVFIRLSNRHINDPFPRDNLPPFDLMQTMEIMQIKYDIGCFLIDEQNRNSGSPTIIQQCLVSAPKIVVLSCPSIKIFECLDFFKSIKKFNPNIITIAVGHLATYCTKRICSPDLNVDFVIRGEFQIVLADFLQQMVSANDRYVPTFEDGYIFSKSSSQLSKLHIIENVNVLPQVRYTKRMLLDYSNLIPLPVGKPIIWGRIFTSYGCPGNCVFCSQTIRLTYGRNYRTRSIFNIITEIKYQKFMGANVIEFSDDNFTASSVHLETICQNIIKDKLEIKWGTHIRIDELSLEQLTLMKQAGCIYIRCGIESGSEQVLAMIKKTSQPDKWFKKSTELFKLCKKLKITTVANLILGNPQETEEDINKTEELLFALEPDIVQIQYFCPYPGSLAYTELSQELSNEELAQMQHHNNYFIKDSANLLIARQKNLIKKFYFRHGYILKHIFKFGRYYMFNIDKFISIVRSLPRLISN